MKILETAIPHAFRILPEQIVDGRGRFWELWRSSELETALGRPFVPVQVNQSVSRRNTLRGIHDYVLPPGQANVITCVRGQVLDVLVDLRVGSPTFGAVETTQQDEDSGVAVVAPEGVGHGFLALTEEVCMHYVCNAEYEQGTMIDVDALDPDLAIPWNLTEPPLRSEKDASAPGLWEAVERGLLPSYEQCLEHYSSTAPFPSRRAT